MVGQDAGIGVALAKLELISILEPVRATGPVFYLVVAYRVFTVTAEFQPFPLLQ